MTVHDFTEENAFVAFDNIYPIKKQRCMGDHVEQVQCLCA